MNSCCHILPGIKKIGWVKCEMLPKQLDLSGLSRLPVPLLADINEITFFGTPDCRCVSDIENNGISEAASLKFLSGEDLPFKDHIAFVVTDVNDNSYIIGAFERPFPVIKTERSSGSPSGDPAGIRYEITHKAIRTMVPCLI